MTNPVISIFDYSPPVKDLKPETGHKYGTWHRIGGKDVFIGRKK